jgi:hypothetical protein
VFHALMRGIMIVAQAGADTLELIRRNRNPHATAANQQTPFGFPGADLLRWILS